jgi:hypothetical protein
VRRAPLTLLLTGLLASGALALTTDQYLAYLTLFAVLVACLSVLALGSVMPDVRERGAAASRR